LLSKAWFCPFVGVKIASWPEFSSTRKISDFNL